MKQPTSLHRLGINVRSARRRADISQEQLALAADMDRTYISGIERGVRNPTILVLVRVSRALDMSVSDLLSGIS